MKRLTREAIRQVAYLDWHRQSQRPGGPDVDEWIDTIIDAARHGADRQAVILRHNQQRRRASSAHAQQASATALARAALARPVLVAVACACGLRSSDQLLDAHQVRARDKAAWVVRNAWRPMDGRGLSYPEIALALGGMDHSSVIAAVRRVDALIAQDPELDGWLRGLVAAPARDGGRVAA